MAAIKALELWCKTQCEGYRDVSISNMTTSFRSGLAFCALIHKFRPDLIDYDSLRKEDVFENNKLAFQVAEDKLGIPSLLDAEDMVALRIPDRLSILTYVSQYYNYFKGRPPVGGVKRPAEGSREEPSEKKNLPVVARPFVTKPPEKRLPPPVLASRTSPKLAETVVSAENAAKSGTLSSKCVACRSHVHLVQRHFVDGRLFHRSCFTCSECSCVLHVGGYKPGQEPDTFVCKAHQKRAPSEGWSQTSRSSERLNRSCQTQRSPRPSSVLSAPLNIVLKPVDPVPPSQSWTTSAQRTQTDRQRFFQAPPEPLVSNRKSSEDGKSRARTEIGKKLAAENCNNNNRRPFTIRAAERRFGGEPGPADKPGPGTDKRRQGPAGSLAGQPGSSETNNKERSCPKAVSPDGARPATARAADKDPVSERRTQTNLVEHRPALSGAEAAIGRRASDTSTAKPSSAPLTAGGGRSFAPNGRADLSETSPRKQLQGNLTGIRLPVQSPGRRPAVESVSSSASAPTIHGDPPGAKKGKYLSPTNASRTEMRSPSVTSRHIPPEQIERELIDIETNLAQLEKEGVALEKRLRGCEEEGDGDVLMDPLMVDWFNLIRKKQMYVRKESELVYIARTQELEQQQPGVEVELRRLLDKPDHLKSAGEQQRETVLMKTLMEIVDSRNAIVEGLDEDRRREVEEDERLNEMMKNLGVKKAKNKRKSSISKLFRRRSKRRVE